MDGIDRLFGPLRPGERVSVQAAVGGAATDVIGFVVGVDERTVTIVDRHGHEHALERTGVTAGRRVGVSRGRDPRAFPRELLDAVAARAGASGTPWVARISDLLAGLQPPEAVAPWGETATLAGTVARVEGEWVTLRDAVPDAVVPAAWWATRQGARSVQVRTDDPEISDALARLGFRRPPAPPASLNPF